MSSTNNEYLHKRINKILDNRLDGDKETLEALQDLSKFFTENTLESRQNLRSQIEKRSLSINEEFLGAFSEVKTSLDVLLDDISSMTRLVNDMKSNLKSFQAETSNLIQQTNSLQNESNKLIFQSDVSKVFLKRFQLNELEHKMLYGKDKDANTVTQEFFTVLDRINAIHSDCKILLQSGYQTVALDIMEEMALHQECALEKLYRWTQNHCRNLDSNEIGPLVVQSMNRLQDRPVLFKYVIDEYATTRRALLVRNFIDALTVGGPNGNPKPIEMHAHDPKRYVGDMFAWLHQAIPSERENLLMLLKNCEKNDITDQIQNALINITDGLCHPLKVRVETILNSETQTITLYAVGNLVRFYRNIIENTVKNGSLQQCLVDLEEYSDHSYLKSLEIQVKEILYGQNMKIREVPKTDLVPPHSMERLLNILKEILSVASMVEGRQSDIKKITACVIDPLLEAVTESASHLPTVDMAVYLLNCVYQIQSTLALYEYMDEKMERLQAQADAQLDTLTSEQASSLVSNLNLGPIYSILHNKAFKIEMNLLMTFTEKLDRFLEMPEMYLLPQINLMLSSTQRKTVQKRSYSVIIAIYTQLYNNNKSDAEEDPQRSTIFKRTPYEITDILKVE